MKGYDAWKTSPPDEPREIELAVAECPDLVLRRALQDALFNEPPYSSMPIASDAGHRTTRAVIIALLRGGYGKYNIVLRPDEAAKYRAGMASAAADRAYHQD